MKINRIIGYSLPQESQNQVNYKAMKSSQFEGLDYFCMRQQKAPIEKFNGLRDFYNWALIQLNKKIKKDLRGKSEGTKEKRISLLEAWKAGLENYSPIVSLITLPSLVKNLKTNNDNLPPIFNSTVFEETISDLEGALFLDREFQFDISSVYKKNLQDKMLLITTRKSEFQEGWIKITPSKNEEEVKKNAELLNVFSRKTWCTKGVKSEIYVKNFGFRIFVRNGEPVLCIRLQNNTVCEIQGSNNDSVIPQNYRPLIMDYIDKNNLELDCDMEAELAGYL